MPNELKIHNRLFFIFDSEKDLVNNLTQKVFSLIESSITEHGICSIALSGGSTPKQLYANMVNDLKAKEIPWKNVFFFLGDERCVDESSSELNANMINSTLLSNDLIPKENFITTHFQSTDPMKAALLYEDQLKTYFGLASHELPKFDILFLGLGPDGHTASLFPGTSALKETRRLFTANYVETFNSYRLTLTYPVINNAKEQIFIVTGSSKAKILSQIVFNEGSVDYPASRVNNSYRKPVLWFTDTLATADFKNYEIKGGNVNV